MADLAHPGRVKSIGGFVENDKARTMHERHRQPYALFHACGELADLLAGSIGQPDQFKYFANAFSIHTGAQAGNEFNIVPGRKIRHKCGGAQQRADIFQGVGVVRRDKFAKYVYFPGCWVDEPECHAKCGGLACAVRPEEAEHLTFISGNVDRVHGFVFAKDLGQIGSLENDVDHNLSLFL